MLVLLRQKVSLRFATLGLDRLERFMRVVYYVGSVYGVYRRHPVVNTKRKVLIQRVGLFCWTARGVLADGRVRFAELGAL